MIISLQNISKSYNKQIVLDMISYTFIGPGLYIIYGPSGSGKTTLLNLLASLDKPTSGEISFSDKAKAAVGVIFQSHYLIGDLSAYENVVLPLLIQNISFKRERVINIFKYLNIENLFKRKIKTCSGGEAQRINIARTLLKNPSCILADEPTGSVDEKTALFIKDKLVELSKQRLVIVVTHDISLFGSIEAVHIKIHRGKIHEK